ncbi:transglutaminase family protein [Paenibacillus sp. HWE-109]|uniref:transglutaminase-like domain-containing protein n=1 Tax=Paenibacillus sp. HWE-109 TaxID=1306526 RepID=UPI001EDD29F2|nr:transglutaminase family protein [Paenibacillus sp. HWE-109]UKS29226.1 transglutaminase family protein [Paenibacillus sp. HWE-109]
MILTHESLQLEDYLIESEEVDYTDPAIQILANTLFLEAKTEVDFVQKAFEFVRDRISHSWDIQSSRITRTASETLHFREGICYAKSGLLCAILRSKGIPTGFCYQRLTLGDTPDTGYCLHALNAVYLKSLDKWIRLDARGNKVGVQAEFAIDEEKLAFPIREHYDEVDYAGIYIQPNKKTIDTLKQHTDCIQMILHGLPTSL